MSEPLRVLVADDELMARKRLLRLLAALPDVEICGECKTGSEVLQHIRAGGVDVVLLDINMPELSGMEALQLMPPDRPHVVFCTAYAEHAVEAFAEGAVDYLLKPIEAARLQKALDRARERLSVQRGRASLPALDRLAVPTCQGIVLVPIREISHAELGDDELVTIHAASGAILTDFSLQDLEKKLPDCFQRVHRRALLNLDHVARLEPTETGGFVARTTFGQSVVVSRQAARNLRARFGLRKAKDDV
jgi:two-component system, LytTR family, response regulator